MHLALSYLIISYLFCCLLGKAAGHGYVHSVVVDNISYPGWNPFSDPYTSPPPRIVRKVMSDGFVAANDPDLACHHGGNDGTSAIANAPAGSQVIFQWGYWLGDHKGPVSTYMTTCNGDCSTFSANNAKWFKIDAGGYDTTEKLWASDKLRASNNSWVSVIPAKLSPGQYLMRHEIVALHSYGTPQFYPSCSQINVSGTGTGQPSDKDLVSMQELYGDVTFPNIDTDFGTFTIPGPTPVNFDGSGNIGTTPPSTTMLAPSSTTTEQNSLPPSTASRTPSNHCRLAARRLMRRH